MRRNKLPGNLDAYLEETQEVLEWHHPYSVSKIITDLARQVHTLGYAKWELHYLKLMQHARTYASIAAGKVRPSTHGKRPDPLLGLIGALQSGLESRVYGQAVEQETIAQALKAIEQISTHAYPHVRKLQLADAHSVLAQLFWWHHQVEPNPQTLRRAEMHDSLATGCYEQCIKDWGVDKNFYDHLVLMALLYAEEGYIIGRVRRAMRAWRVVRRHSNRTLLRRRARLIALWGVDGERRFQAAQNFSDGITDAITTLSTIEAKRNKER